MRYIFLLGFIVMCMHGCGIHPANPENTADDNLPVNTEAFRGEVIKYSPSAGPDSPFSLYYPKDSCEQYPLLVILDPHADGYQAAKKYQQLAEKYKIILAASDRIKNGMIPTQFLSLFNGIVKEVKTNFPVDSSQIFILGFSGGARMAAVTALSQDNISGIITCGAGTPEIVKKNSSGFTYIGMAGYKDFNFNEVYRSEKSIRQSPLEANFIYFDGGHEWPNDSVMEFAFASISDKKSDKESLTKLVMSCFKKNYKPQDEWRKYLDYRSVQTYINSMTGVKNEKIALEEYLNGNKAKTAQQEIDRVFESEYAVNQELNKAFSTRDSVWWRNKIKGLNKTKDNTAKTCSDYENARILGYISMSCYMYVSSALEQGDVNSAAKFLDIYLQADPNNADVSYFYGIYFAKTGQYSAAIDSLYNALEKGFKDLTRWSEEQAFNPLKDSLRYSDLEARLNAQQ